MLRLADGLRSSVIKHKNGDHCLGLVVVVLLGITAAEPKRPMRLVPESPGEELQE